MGLTVTQVGNDEVDGRADVRYFDVTFDSSYPTSGESLTLAQLKLSVLWHINCEPSALYSFSYVRSTAKLIALLSGAQVADTTDISTVTTRVKVAGQR